MVPSELAHRRRPSPNAISLARIRRGNSPHILVDPRILLPQPDAEELVRPGGSDRIAEIVGVPVALVAIIAPGMRILVDKQWRHAADVFDATKVNYGPLQRIPGGGRDRVRRRANGHQVHGHQLGVNVPAILQKSLVRQPAHGEGGTAIQHPLPIDAAVESGRQGSNARVRGKILAAHQDAAEENRGIDGRQFRIEEPLAAVEIDEVVEKSVLVGTRLQQESQRPLHTLLALRRHKVMPFGRDAERSEAKARGGYAADTAQRPAIGGRTIPHRPGFRICFVVEVIAGARFHVVQQRLRLFRYLGEWTVDEDTRRVVVPGQPGSRSWAVARWRRRGVGWFWKPSANVSGRAKCEHAGSASPAQQLPPGNVSSCRKGQNSQLHKSNGGPIGPSHSPV